MKLPLNKINSKKAQLLSHKLLNDPSLFDLTSLHIFMERHVYCVWDFMCLLKSLQHKICPSTTVWVPNKWIRSGAARLINEIVLGEESDIDINGTGTICHHDLYCQAMLEVGSDGRDFESFIHVVEREGFRTAVEQCNIPASSRSFMEKTFQFIDTGKPHVIAAAFCFGRETVLPEMFTNILNTLDSTDNQFDKFKYYLERHIQIDGDEHGPASIQLIETLCENDPVKIHEAECAAIESIEARIELWDDVLYDIENNKDLLRHN